ncbi:kinase-like domain-containing protein [Spinellus fusiger]|nr:kinase-like domain-containing protein [Spinellus fusiger]
MTKETGQATSSIRSGHEIDVQTLEKYLTKHIPGFSSPLQVSQFKLGQSNPTYLLKDSNQQQYVLRKKPPGALISATAHAIEREYRIIHALGTRSDVPVPKVYCLCNDNSVIGTSFYVMEFLQGRIYSDIRMLTLPYEERRLCWLSAIDTLVKLHKIDIHAIGLSDYGRNHGFYTRQMKSLSIVSKAQGETKDKETSELVGAIPRLDELFSWFEQNQVADKATIIHGDYKIDNLIFHPTESRVIGVLDWELSTIGHPLSDLSNLLQPFYVPCTMSEGIMIGFKGLKELPVPGVEELMKSYCQLIGEPYPIRGWSFAIAFSFFRITVILQGIAARVARKQASSEEAVKYARLFKPTAQIAFDIIEQGVLGSKSSKL